MRRAFPRARGAALLAATLALAAAAAAPGAASASSLVYIKGGNVWLAAPDGSHAYEVTTDGTASDPYYRPSQTDDGTIVAIRGNNPAKLFRLRQNGAQLNPPFSTASPLGNLLDAEVSPDGRTVAYSFVSVVNGCAPGYSCADPKAAVAYTYADHLGDPGGGLQQNDNWRWISWAGNNRTILTEDSNIVYYDNVGGGDNSNAQWFDECTAGLADCSQSSGWGIHDLHVSRDGTKAAWISQAPDPDPYTISDDPYLQLGTTGGDVATGNPPQAPTTPACAIGPGPKESTGSPQWDRPTFSPDGSAVAWSEADGIHTTPATLNDCSGVTAGDHLVIPGGSQPFWGPADVNPGPRTPAPGPGPQPAPQPNPQPPSGGPVSAAHVTLATTRLATILRLRAIPFSCRLPQAGICSVRASISRGDARRLRLRRLRRRGGYVLGTGRVRLAHAGRAGGRIPLVRAALNGVRHAHSLQITLTVTGIYASGRRTTTLRLLTRR